MRVAFLPLLSVLCLSGIALGGHAGSSTPEPDLARLDTLMKGLESHDNTVAPGGGLRCQGY